jgi:glycosyltransferase involved in cell wall biosynthesis
LKAKYPKAHFLGHRPNDELAEIYASADVFVFPSRTDTFGLVLIEAMACGLPVAAFPVPGPLDIIGPTGHGPDGTLPMRVGSLGTDLERAITEALRCDKFGAAVYGASYNWDRATDQFLAALTDAKHQRVAVAA